MVTMKDVARLAGVSHGTVSNVINNPQKVKLETVKKVEKAMEELGYQPDATARSLRSSKSRNIGLVFPDITDSFYAEIFSGIERVLSENGYNASLYISSEIPSREEQILSTVQKNRMDGLIISTCQPDNKKVFDALIESGLEVVFMNREITDRDYNYLGFNNRDSFREITAELLKKNYRKIALITGSLDYSTEADCLQGYKEAFAESDNKIEQKLVREIDLNKESAFRAGIEIIRSGIKPEVILTTSTTLARGIKKSLLLNKGILPFEPRLICLGENTWIGHGDKQTMVIERKARLLGSKAAKLLIENIEQSVFSETRKIIIDNLKLEAEIEEKKQNTPAVRRGKKAKKELKVLMLNSSAARATESLLPDFVRQEGIEVNIDTYSYDQLYREINQAAKGSEYDVFQVDLPWLSEFVEKDILLNLDRYINENPDSITGLIPGILDVYAKYKENFYVLPYMYGSQLLFYRKDAFSSYKMQRQFYEKHKTELKVPTNWAEFNAIARFFTREYNPESPTKYGTTLGGSYTSGAAICEFLPRLWSYGGRCFDDQGNVTLESREAIKALKNYLESYKYASPDSTDHWWDDQVREFSRGDAAMMVLFIAHATGIVDKEKSRVVGKIGYETIPGGTPLLGGWSLGINRNSDNKEKAFRFLSWSCDEELAIPYTILGGSTPCLNLYESSELLTIYPWLSKALQSFEISRKRKFPQKKNGGIISERKYEKIIGKAVHEVITGNLVAEESIREAAKQLEKIVK